MDVDESLLSIEERIKTTLKRYSEGFELQNQILNEAKNITVEPPIECISNSTDVKESMAASMHLSDVSKSRHQVHVLKHQLNQVDTIREKLHKKDVESASLHEQIDILRTFEDKYYQAVARIELLESDNIKLQNTIESRDTHYSSNLKLVEQLQRKLGTVEELLESKHAEQHQSSKEKIALLEAECIRLNRELASKGNEVSRVECQLTVSAQQAQMLQRKAENMAKSTEEELKLANSKIIELSQSSTHAEVLQMKMEALNKELNLSKIHYEDTISNLRKGNSDLKNEVNLWKGKYDGLESEFRSSHESFNRISQDLASTQDALNNKSLDYEDLLTQNTEVISELKSNKVEIETLKSNLEKMTGVKNMLSQQLLVSQSEAVMSNSRLEKLNKETVENAQENKTIQSELLKLRDKFREVESSKDNFEKLVN